MLRNIFLVESLLKCVVVVKQIINDVFNVSPEVMAGSLGFIILSPFMNVKKKQQLLNSEVFLSSKRSRKKKRSSDEDHVWRSDSVIGVSSECHNFRETQTVQRVK